MKPICQPFQTLDKKPIPPELRIWQDVEQIRKAQLNESDSYENTIKNMFTVTHSYDVFDNKKLKNAKKFKISRNVFECYSNRQLRSYLRDLIALPYGAGNCEIKIVIKKKTL
jgi:hypothetical protein